MKGTHWVGNHNGLACVELQFRGRDVTRSVSKSMWHWAVLQRRYIACSSTTYFKTMQFSAKSKPTSRMSQGWWISDRDKRERGSGKPRMQLGLHKKHRKRQRGEDTPCWGKATVWACPRENNCVQGPQGRKGRREETVLGSEDSQRRTTSSIIERSSGRGSAGGGSNWNLRQWVARNQGVKEERERENPEGSQRRS